MIRFIQLARGGAMVGVMATATVAAQDPPLRTLTLDVEYAEPFSCVSGVRELSDGRVQGLQSFLSFTCFFLNWWHVFGSFQDAIDPRNAPSESQA